MPQHLPWSLGLFIDRLVPISAAAVRALFDVDQSPLRCSWAAVHAVDLARLSGDRLPTPAAEWILRVCALRGWLIRSESQDQRGSTIAYYRWSPAFCQWVTRQRQSGTFAAAG